VFLLWKHDVLTTAPPAQSQSFFLSLNKTMHLRFGFKPTSQDSNSARNHCLLVEFTLLVSGPNKAQVLYGVYVYVCIYILYIYIYIIYIFNNMEAHEGIRLNEMSEKDKYCMIPG